MQPEEAVQVNRRADRRVPGRAMAIDGRSAVVLGLAKRHDHVEPVDRAALKDGDEQLGSASAGGFNGPRQKRRREPERHHRHAARFEKDRRVTMSYCR